MTSCLSRMFKGRSVLDEIAHAQLGGRKVPTLRMGNEPRLTGSKLLFRCSCQAKFHALLTVLLRKNSLRLTLVGLVMG